MPPMFNLVCPFGYFMAHLTTMKCHTWARFCKNLIAHINRCTDIVSQVWTALYSSVPKRQKWLQLPREWGSLTLKILSQSFLNLPQQVSQSFKRTLNSWDVQHIHHHRWFCYFLHESQEFWTTRKTPNNNYKKLLTEILLKSIGGEKKFIQGIGVESWRKDTTCKT